jgi:hypothetical protein
MQPVWYHFCSREFFLIRSPGGAVSQVVDVSHSSRLFLIAQVCIIVLSRQVNNDDFSLITSVTL